MTRGVIHDQNTEKHMEEKHMRGCIAGFFHIFHRNHLVCSKRLFPKRVTYTSDVIESVPSVGSPAISSEFEMSNPRESARSKASPAVAVTAPRDVSARSSIAVSSFDFKEGLRSPSKSARELPRLSLDSRLHPRGIRTKDDSIDEGSETQRRSPSVVARLMGLEVEPLLPSSNCGADLSEKLKLRRSASESRSKDLQHYPSNSAFATCSEISEKSSGGRRLSNCNTNVPVKSGNPRSALHSEPPMRPRKMIAQQQRKGVYDCNDFFTEPSVGKRLKMRGIEDNSLQKILHHSKPPASRTARRNFVYDRTCPYEESPAVVMKLVRSPRRLSTEPLPPRFQLKAAPRRNLNSAAIDKFSSPSSRRNPATTGRSISPVTTRRKLNIGKQRRLHETSSTETRKVSPVQSPRKGSWRLNQTASQSPRRCKLAAEDEPSPSSRTDTEMTQKPKIEESYNGGRSLMKRCNNLLNSIEEISSTSKNSTESQLSPVSVLDSSLHKEDESPSPVTKCAINIKDMEDEIWSTSSVQEDPDFAYMSKIIKASNNFKCHTDFFSVLEKEQPLNAIDTCKSAIVKRRLTFDTIAEIIVRKKQLSPWKLVSFESQLNQIWCELQRFQKRDESADMFEDLAQDSFNGWGLELSEVGNVVERLVFKDLIGETIRGLMGLTESRRKLVF